MDGFISISGAVHKLENDGRNNVIASVRKNDQTLWVKPIAKDDTVGLDTNKDLMAVPVTVGGALFHCEKQSWKSR